MERLVIKITVTGRLTGNKALLYEFPGRKGGRKFVSTYTAFVQCVPTREWFEFSVIRDSSAHVFGGIPQNPYGEYGECPPCAGTPYRGLVREDGKVGFRIQLFEAGCENADTLVGQGSIPRKHLQIHFGAAAAYGCIMVAGRRRLYHASFEKRIRAMLAHTDTIQVMVEPR
jgi:hypothetical protein